MVDRVPDRSSWIAAPLPAPPLARGVLQRKCACGGSPGVDGECAECRKKRLQRRAAVPSELGIVPPRVHDVLRSPGQPLDADTRAFMEPRFGHNFSQVRIHTDEAAAASAQSVNALAYTVGQQVVFDDAHYAPQTAAGRRLIAHELAHVVQQSGTTVAVANERHLEAEADRVEAAVMSNDAAPPIMARSGSTLLKKDGAGQAQPPQPVAPVPPSQRQQLIIETARSAAAIRAQVALMRLRGIVPPGPQGRPDPGDAMRRRAIALARVMFEWDNPNMDQIEEVVGAIVTQLTNPQVMIGGRGDPECGNRAAYVRGLRPPIVLCPTFFSDTAEQRIRTMIHEAAHLARIGSAALGESYCVIFDCATSCGGFDSADSWAQFIHCLSGQTPDQPTVIQGQPGRGGQQRGSGGTP